MVPLVLLVHPDPPWSTFTVKFQKVWIRMDRSRPGGPRGPQPPLVDLEHSGPSWTMFLHFPDEVVPIVLAPGQVAPGVVPGQPQPQAQGQVIHIVPVSGEVALGVVLGQHQPEAQGQVVPVVLASGQVVPVVQAAGQVGPGVVPDKSQLQGQEQVIPVVSAQAQVAPGVAPGQPQPPINQQQAQRQVALAAHWM